ncbi:hypothetical protein J2T09_005295 [Neorhizobium huautlense]|uniref:DUF3618 domain-containing protein n=1 Tax=Neorhizobium huautlense TaxID=67774 RepID=A0ABT9Q1B0_9HYPH|nr:hypothetical protein [Neorhizobium huautlense]MDP9840508.1 hypothetical protein [Neorhizobium huautlense]
MTNSKARGFDSAEQLREHLAELDEEAPTGDPAVERGWIDPREEIAALQNEVAELHQRLASICGYTDGVSAPTGFDHPWRRIAVTVAATVIFGRLVQKLGLGAAGAVAAPLIATQLGRRF